MQHITRIAPSPTGYFHIGSARTALFNWLIAKSTGGKFILRIDDTDLARNTEEAVQIIYDAMDWLQLDYDLTFRQSRRIDLYNHLASLLLKVGLAKKDGGAIRLTKPIVPEFWEDTLAGKVSITPHDLRSIDGLVLIKSDGMPTYHFASVIDDMHSDITWIVRGVDHMSNTAKHVAIWNALNEVNHWKYPNLPKFTHLGLITQNGKKVSKRDGAGSLLDYKAKGINVDALCNWLLRLGWGPAVDDKSTALISRERALELFLERGKMRSAPANMDLVKLDSFDRKYKAKAHD